jgi:hypothetical protein
MAPGGNDRLHILMEPTELCSLMSVAPVDVCRHYCQFSCFENVCPFSTLVLRLLCARLWVPLPSSCVPCPDMVFLQCNRMLILCSNKIWGTQNVLLFRHLMIADSRSRSLLLSDDSIVTDVTHRIFVLQCPCIIPCERCPPFEAASSTVETYVVSS